MAHTGALVAFARRQRHGCQATVHRGNMHGRTVLVGVCLVGLTMGCGERRPCGAEPGHGAAAASYGVRRAGETVAAMQVLGLRWSKDPHDTEVFLLGYPNLGLTAIASAESPWMGDSSGLHHTYA